MQDHREGTAKRKRLCTHCGQKQVLTLDHVFPTCLFLEPSNERSLKVPSCKGKNCNGRSDEALLKSFFLLFDNRVALEVMQHLGNTTGGRVDYRQFRSVCSKDFRECFLDAKLTRLFTKIFMGLRRSIMGPAWFFLPEEKFHLSQVTKESGALAIRTLPLKVGERNLPTDFAPPFENIKAETKFRDFYYATQAHGMTLRYGRKDYGNELLLLCLTELL